MSYARSRHQFTVIVMGERGAEFAGKHGEKFTQLPL